MAGLILLILGILIMGILLVVLGSYLDSRERVRLERETLEVRQRAVETKRQLDVEAFKAARGIQETLLRHGGQR